METDQKMQELWDAVGDVGVEMAGMILVLRSGAGEALKYAKPSQQALAAGKLPT